ncbi:hypothetical protein DTL21_27090 [Bremerella cremea]|uniref:Carboxypeptidase regulatory-like domain-containing protein n=1 Tax=Blastopirellula marina TaxID=124 RepID=A0A2S8FC15_9BACT|nr:MULTISPECIES: hypothetical protein [Pirellulaceae]PQO29706.1 hypothetical protein C5Y83_27045 [Blastopirellula marina]RCS43008.1 hypothetical protein DTL21_27090 [Bremerella cremea]
MRFTNDKVKHHLYAAVATIALTAVVAGCGSSRPDGLPETAIVKGVVNLKGSPLNEGVVRFVPDDTSCNPGVGMINPDGSFELSTYDRLDGATVGKHKVVIHVEPHLDGSKPDPPVQTPRKYHDIATTPLEVEVKSGETNEIVLDVE